MLPLPREFLWAVIIALTIALIATWPSHLQLIGHVAQINSQPAADVTYWGMRPGEWILCLITFMLWGATARLVRGADETAKRQLRAYVYIEKADFTFTQEDGWQINYRIKNFGQTPAHHVQLRSVLRVVDWRDENTEIPTPDSDEALGSMAPSGDFYDYFDNIEGEANFDEIKNGTKAIYLVGSIHYDTVFGLGPRITNFRYLIGGTVGCEGHEMYADNTGNDAT
jgi:hypothetical protein